MTLAAGATSHRHSVIGTPYSAGIKKNAAKKSSSMTEHRCQDTYSKPSGPKNRASQKANQNDLRLRPAKPVVTLVCLAVPQQKFVEPLPEGEPLALREIWRPVQCPPHDLAQHSVDRRVFALM